MHACIKSNIPLKTIVVRGVSDTAFSHKDIGRKRSGGDTLAIEGYKNHNVLAAAARIVYTYENGISFGKHPKIDNADTLDVVARHPGLEEWCRRSNAAKKNLLIPAGPAAGFFYLFSLSNEAKAEDFFDDFTKGEGLQKGDPALALRNQLIRATRTPGSSPFVGYEGRQYMAGAMICTWNAIKRGEKREVIRVPKKAMFKIK